MAYTQKKYDGPSMEERVKALTDQLESGVKEIYASDHYAEYMSAMAKFHHYSFGNIILILFQYPKASRVAGIKTWNELGRHVNKGEHGIQILAPCPFQKIVSRIKRDPNTGQILYGPDGQPLKEQTFVEANRFRAVTVFDISQTDGKELPSLKAQELTGEVEDYESVFQRLAALSPLPVIYDTLPGQAKGQTNFLEQKVIIRPGMSQLQTIKTLVHEITHAMLHDPDNQPLGVIRDRRRAEVEAESVAYVVCQHFGLDTSDYSLGYVAGWGRGKELDELKSSLQTIHATATKIIDAFSPPAPEVKREPRRSHTKSKRVPTR